LSVEQGIRCILRESSIGTGLNNRLIGYDFRLIGLILHPVGEVFGPVSLGSSGGREIGCLRGLRASSNGKVVSVNAALVHLPPLSAHKNSGESGHNYSGSSPSKSGFFKSAHLLFDRCELLCGGWRCCYGVHWLGFLDRRGRRGLGLISLGYDLFVHSGLRLMYCDKIVN
jgi:hypothetical protein